MLTESTTARSGVTNLFNLVIGTHDNQCVLSDGAGETQMVFVSLLHVPSRLKLYTCFRDVHVH